ncbi:DUF3306 domain-containing protein [Shewanella saliphila]|uniref:DUF3306 domain-containing protein n=1 Tax=Shewanella saliphila TaxID=2282698 RepID=A0ABQ2Q521_9GAMM|nr:DUF3306 domain-containing protein [Shewanella saliphila]MCL1101620.1 DUF3306 domain-containing protein [Shewanella saliphila]GGP51628.1 hypothetical protein GCM10009409_17610 [Shewanella saliphila]
MSSSDGLLSRWELRRQRVAEEAEQLEQEAAHVDETVDVVALDDASHTNDVDEALTESNVEDEPLPDPNTIEVGGSFARFMAKNVDPTAKAAALRALWKQPQYGHIDGLLEYALDYSNQPVLSADVSAELANKVFRYVVEKTDDAEDEKLAEVENNIETPLEAEMAETVNNTDVIDSDESLSLSQQSTEPLMVSHAQVQDDDQLVPAFASDEAKG